MQFTTRPDVTVEFFANLFFPRYGTEIKTTFSTIPNASFSKHVPSSIIRSSSFKHSRITHVPVEYAINVTALLPCSLDKRIVANSFPAICARSFRTDHGLSMKLAPPKRIAGHRPTPRDRQKRCPINTAALTNVFLAKKLMAEPKLVNSVVSHSRTNCSPL